MVEVKSVKNPPGADGHARDVEHVRKVPNDRKKHRICGAGKRCHHHGRSKQEQSTQRDDDSPGGGCHDVGCRDRVSVLEEGRNVRRRRYLLPVQESIIRKGRII